MNKFVRIFVALLATVAIATPALAIDADIKGFFQARGIAYDNLDLNDDTDDNVRGVDQRFRLWFTGAANENVKMVVGFEADHTWGDTNLGDLGSDAKSTLEIKHAYIDFNLPEIDTNVKAGVQGWDQGRSFIISDDASGLRIVKSMPEFGGNLAFSWIKVEEGTNVVDASTTLTDSNGDTVIIPGSTTVLASSDDNADADYYSLQFDGQVNGWSVVPFVAYYDLGENDNVSGANDEIYYLGVSADGKIGAFGVSATAIVNDWSIDQAAGSLEEEDGNGYVLFAKGSYAVDASTFSLEGAYMGDSDATNGAFKDVSNYNNFAEVLAGGKFDGRGQIGSSTVISDGLMNLVYLKATAAHKYGEKHSVSASYIYAQSAEDGFQGVKDTVTFGHEIDAYYNYKITKGLTATIGGGYLMADDEFAEALAGNTTASADDAWKAGTMLTYKF